MVSSRKIESSTGPAERFVSSVRSRRSTIEILTFVFPSSMFEMCPLLTPECCDNCSCVQSFFFRAVRITSPRFTSEVMSLCCCRRVVTWVGITKKLISLCTIGQSFSYGSLAGVDVPTGYRVTRRQPGCVQRSRQERSCRGGAGRSLSCSRLCCKLRWIAAITLQAGTPRLVASWAVVSCCETVRAVRRLIADELQGRGVDTGRSSSTAEGFEEDAASSRPGRSGTRREARSSVEVPPYGVAVPSHYSGGS